MADPLTPLQRRILALLAPIRPAWTLTGGAALAGFHLQHRTTRDLDLFWHGKRDFAREPDECIRSLEGAGLRVDVLQRAPSFVRLRATDDAEAVVVDLVAEPVPAAAPPTTVATSGGAILVDTAQEILGNKLGALLHRAELRDVIDIRALLAKGLDLDRALTDAAKKDGGFSPLMVAHLLHDFPVARLAAATATGGNDAAELARFCRELSGRISSSSRP